jgi:hypothetical protein
MRRKQLPKTNKVAAPPVDLMEDAKPVAKPSDLKQIVELAREMYRLHKEIEAEMKALDAKQAAFNLLRLTVLPERMEVAGLKSFELDNGYLIQIEDLISASIPTESAIEKADGVDKVALLKRREAALKWLRSNKAESLIKNKLVAEFGKGEDKAAKKFFKLISKAGYQTKCEEAVNYQTLNAFIKESLRNGKEVPAEPFALFIGKKAEISQAKQQQKKN